MTASEDLLRDTKTFFKLTSTKTDAQTGGPA